MKSRKHEKVLLFPVITTTEWTHTNVTTRSTTFLCYYHLLEIDFILSLKKVKINLRIRTGFTTTKKVITNMLLVAISGSIINFE